MKLYSFLLEASPNFTKSARSFLNHTANIGMARPMNAEKIMRDGMKAQLANSGTGLFSQGNRDMVRAVRRNLRTNTKGVTDPRTLAVNNMRHEVPSAKQTYWHLKNMANISNPEAAAAEAKGLVVQRTPGGLPVLGVR